MSVEICGVVCHDDPKREYPCVEPALHRRTHRDSRGWTWGLTNEEIAASTGSSEADQARAAARGEYWRRMTGR